MPFTRYQFSIKRFSLHGFFDCITCNAILKYSPKGLEEEQKKPEGKSDVKSILRLMIDGNLSSTEIRDEIITLLFAGHDTTSNLFTWTFYYLSQYPDICVTRPL